MSDKKIFLYALSTCVWCKKTKRLLDELGAKYDFVFVDLLEGEEKEKAREELAKYNPRRSFPTLLIDDEIILGFEDDKIKEVLAK